MLEKQIQDLICDHPYLLDAAICGSGRKERCISVGRIDIDFQTPEGTIVVECKISPLVSKDVLQLRRYVNDLAQTGEIVLKAYLVGQSPTRSLDTKLLMETPCITVAELVSAIPLHLSFCRGGHYFDADLPTCPYDGSDKLFGHDLSLV